nr:unnamed protein product [Digitaria exilis]
MHIATCVWQEKAAAMVGPGGDVSAGKKKKGEWTATPGRRASALAGGALNCLVSFVVFSFLDVLDVVLCLVYKLIDYAVEAEWKACYCTAATSATSAAPPRIGLVTSPAVTGPPKVVRLSASSTKLQLEDVSDTLFVRPSLLADATKKGAGTAAPALTVVSPAIAELIRGKMDRPPRQAPCWSDCDCKVCHSWSTRSSTSSHLYVHVQAPPPAITGGEVVEDVVFIHGFISSSVFWTETVFPAFSAAARGKYRMFAVDLLGFGRSPKPAESLYTMREHVEMIERSVLQRYRLGSFHVVAHSLGSVLALALAVKYPDAVNRTICLTICRHHRVWDRLFRIFTRNRVRTYLIEAFMCHTHNAAWHTLHNIICGSAGRMGAYLDVVSDQLSCKVAVFHGRDDELLPVECTLAVGARVPRARVTVYDRKDHITIIVGQERLFAAELEAIWRSAAAD